MDQATAARARKSLLILVLAGLVASTVGSLAYGVVFYGCFTCKKDVGPCLGPVGVCSQRCEHVEAESDGDGIYCQEIEIWFGYVCDTSGGACHYIEVEPPFPPEPDCTDPASC